jgi:erythromycin esterase
VAGVVVLGACGLGDDRQPTAPNDPADPSPTTRIVGLPPGWAGGSATPNSYELGRDFVIVHGGSASGYLQSRGDAPPPNSFVTFTQGVRADLYRGRRVRLSGYLRVENVTGEGPGLWLRADAPTRIRAFDNMGGRRPTGNNEWGYAEVVLDVPDDVVGLSFGTLLAGPGMAWVDDLRLEVVDSSVTLTAPVIDTPISGVDSAQIVESYRRFDTTPQNLDFEGVTAPEGLAATVDWVRDNTVPFLTDDPAASDDDLDSLLPMIGVARLVALGEGTHGTREFFRMKHRVFQFLVRQLGFTHFGIEASLPEALAVDHYVQTGVGDPAAVVGGMYFWTWSTEEVVDLVKWMRAWNAAGSQPRVSFVGFDMQFPGTAIDSVVAFVSGVEPVLSDSVQNAYACLLAYRNTPESSVVRYDAYRGLPLDAQNACRAHLAAVDSLFVLHAGAWSSSAGQQRTGLMQRLARLVSQWEDYARASGFASTASRDRSMAENVTWWVQREAGAGMMLWAHNAHISRESPWMGGVIAARHGADYLNVALTFSSGTFNAVGQGPTGAFTGLRSHSLGGAVASSIEAVLDATPSNRLLFDTRRIAAGGAAAEPLHARLTMRLIGATFSPTMSPSVYQDRVLLPEDFDLVIWFRNASASRLLPLWSASSLFAPDEPSPSR